eukprot:TRINITY_DN3622_c0_g1_i3.p2 TRINITY_DN3622_c0_g1~~TRINITY_DN3622_c0_g1_i3.p2  ORF type:complete len:254 (+),score=40.50 TRINITY_DN3622_c0_g1_i3:192-953(+)
MINPTAFFFAQSQNTATTPDQREKINEFVKKLLNLNQCLLCKADFNLTSRVPRILVHCGHTLCTSCLKNFYKNFRVRCPLCLKLIKNLDSIEKLPVNHTIYQRLAEEEFKKEENLRVFEEQIRVPHPGKADGVHLGSVLPVKSPTGKFALKKFELPGDVNVGGDEGEEGDGLPDQAQGPATELDYCEYHYDRVKHFFCITHKTSCCRVCMEMVHSKPTCQNVDLYEIEDIDALMREVERPTKINNYMDNGKLY